MTSTDESATALMAVQNVIADYNQTIDKGDENGFLALFAPNAKLTVEKLNASFAGDELKQFFAKVQTLVSPTAQHMYVNLTLKLVMTMCLFSDVS